jgi:hypothetical protein
MGRHCKRRSTRRAGAMCAARPRARWRRGKVRPFVSIPWARVASQAVALHPTVVTMNTTAQSGVSARVRAAHAAWAVSTEAVAQETTAVLARPNHAPGSLRPWQVSWPRQRSADARVEDNSSRPYRPSTGPRARFGGGVPALGHGVPAARGAPGTSRASAPCPRSCSRRPLATGVCASPRGLGCQRECGGRSRPPGAARRA